MKIFMKQGGTAGEVLEFYPSLADREYLSGTFFYILKNIFLEYEKLFKQDFLHGKRKGCIVL